MRFEDTVRTMANALKSADDHKTTAYDSVATVKRVEGDTAWVHIAGGVDETPVKLTVDCKEGDEVQVRVSGGRAWITGNATAPPTDDTIAIEAKKDAYMANISAGTANDIANATRQHFWADGNGVHVTSEAGNSTATRNTLWNSLGMLFRKGANNLLAIVTGDSPSVDIYDGNGNNSSNVVASFGSISRIGKWSDFNIQISSLFLSFLKNGQNYGSISADHWDGDAIGLSMETDTSIGRVIVHEEGENTNAVGFAELRGGEWEQDPLFGDYYQRFNRLRTDQNGFRFYKNTSTVDADASIPFAVTNNGNVTASGTYTDGTGYELFPFYVTTGTINIGSLDASGGTNDNKSGNQSVNAKDLCIVGWELAGTRATFVSINKLCITGGKVYWQVRNFATNQASSLVLTFYTLRKR